MRGSGGDKLEDRLEDRLDAFTEHPRYLTSYYLLDLRALNYCALIREMCGDINGAGRVACPMIY